MNKTDLDATPSPLWRWLVLATLTYLLITGLFFYPYFGKLSSALIGPPEDNMQDLWNTWYSQNVLDSAPGTFFSTRLLFYPEGQTLFYHSFAYSNLLPIFIIRKLFLLPAILPVLITLHNAFMLLSFLLSSLGAFLLIRHLTKSNAAGLVGGFIVGFSPFHYAHLLHHMHVATIQWIPFFVLCFLRYTESRKTSFFLAAVFFYLLSALSSWYYLFYIFFFLLFYYGWLAVRERRLRVGGAFIPVLGITGVTLLLLSPLLVPMVKLAAEHPNAYTGGHNVYIADLAGYLLFHPYHPLSFITRRAHALMRGNPWEMTAYLGIINIALIIWALRNKTGQREQYFSFALWGMVFFMLWALGRCLCVLGQNLFIPMPTLLTEFLPFFRNLRTPSRALVFVYLFMGTVVGFAFRDLSARARQGKTSLLAAAIAVALVLDFYPIHRESTVVSFPAAYELIKSDDDDFGVLDLPLDYVAGNYAMMYQTFHGKPIVHASISRKLTGTLSDRIDTANLRRQEEQLRANRVKYIVIHKDLLTQTPKAVNTDAYMAHYAVVREDDKTLLLRIYD